MTEKGETDRKERQEGKQGAERMYREWQKLKGSSTKDRREGYTGVPV